MIEFKGQKFYTRKELMKMFNTSNSSLGRWFKIYKVKHISLSGKRTYIHEDEVERMLKESEVKGD